MDDSVVYHTAFVVFYGCVDIVGYVERLSRGLWAHTIIPVVLQDSIWTGGNFRMSVKLVVQCHHEADQCLVQK